MYTAENATSCNCQQICTGFSILVVHSLMRGGLRLSDQAPCEKFYRFVDMETQPATPALRLTLAVIRDL
jgi:hypothetical protein